LKKLLVLKIFILSSQDALRVRFVLYFRITNGNEYQ